MKWERILGVFLLVTSLVLAVLLSVKVPLIKTTPLFDENVVTVDPEGLANNFYNATLEPVGKNGYTVTVSMAPYNTTSMDVDLWVVNQTSVYRFELLTEALASGVFNQSEETTLSDEYYASPPQLPNIIAYATEIGITTGGHGDLANIVHDGTYCFVLVNFLNVSASLSVNILQQYVESYTAWLKPNQVTITVIVAVLVAGVGLIIIGSKRSAKEAKRKHQET
jgi:hypothetical protein